MPNQTSMIVASESTMRSPIASMVGAVLAVNDWHCAAMKLSNVNPMSSLRSLALERLIAECLRQSGTIRTGVGCVVGFVSVGSLHRHLQCVLLLLLLNHLLQALGLRHLARFLLGAELQEHRLIDALQRSQFGLFGWVGGMTCCFQSLDVCLTLRSIRPDCANCLKAGCVYRISQIDSCTLSGNRLLALCTERAI